MPYKHFCIHNFEMKKFISIFRFMEQNIIVQLQIEWICLEYSIIIFVNKCWFILSENNFNFITFWDKGNKTKSEVVPLGTLNREIWCFSLYLFLEMRCWLEKTKCLSKKISSNKLFKKKYKFKSKEILKKEQIYLS